MDLKTLQDYKETKTQRLRVASEFQKSHFQYTSKNSKAQGFFLPQSSQHDYPSIDKNDLKSIKATTFADLKKNRGRGVSTHWILSSRNDPSFPSVRRNHESTPSLGIINKDDPPIMTK